MLSVARLVSFWRCIPMQYNCQKSSNFQGLSQFSRIFGKNDKIPGFFQAGKTVTIFPGFPGAVGTLIVSVCFGGSKKLKLAIFDTFSKLPSRVIDVGSVYGTDIINVWHVVWITKLY